MSMVKPATIFLCQNMTLFFVTPLFSILQQNFILKTWLYRQNILYKKNAAIVHVATVRQQHFICIKRVSIKNMYL